MSWMVTHIVDVIDQNPDTGAVTTTATGVPVSLIRGGTGSLSAGGTSSDGGKDTPWTGRARPGAPITDGVMLRAGGRTWLVDLVARNSNPVMGQGLVLSCREVTA